MSTIAWDGAVLAADNGGWAGGLVGRSLKLFPIRMKDGSKWIVGTFGSWAFADVALEFMQGDSPTLPDAREFDEDLSPGAVWALAVNADGECYRVQANLRFDKVLDPFASAGAGRDIALGALAAGATAIQAVGIAEAYTDYAKFGVTAMRFDSDGEIVMAN